MVTHRSQFTHQSIAMDTHTLRKKKFVAKKEWSRISKHSHMYLLLLIVGYFGHGPPDIHMHSLKIYLNTQQHLRDRGGVVAYTRTYILFLHQSESYVSKIFKRCIVFCEQCFASHFFRSYLKFSKHYFCKICIFYNLFFMRG